MTTEEKTQRETVIVEARTWMLTPYVHQARAKGAGCDCMTFIHETYIACGVIPREELPYYPKDWHKHQPDEKYLNGVLRYAHEVPTPQPGDIVLLRFCQAWAHGGIVINWPQLIHSSMR